MVRYKATCKVVFDKDDEMYALPQPRDDRQPGSSKEDHKYYNNWKVNAHMSL